MPKLRKMLGDAGAPECLALMRLMETQSAQTLAARAISTACATTQTPTNALGFLFCGAADIDYEQAGLTETAAVYDALATDELKCALYALQQDAVLNEPQPAKLNWYC